MKYSELTIVKKTSLKATEMRWLKKAKIFNADTITLIQCQVCKTTSSLSLLLLIIVFLLSSFYSIYISHSFAEPFSGNWPSVNFLLCHKALKICYKQTLHWRFFDTFSNRSIFFCYLLCYIGHDIEPIDIMTIKWTTGSNSIKSYTNKRAAQKQTSLEKRKIFVPIYIWNSL